MTFLFHREIIKKPGKAMLIGNLNKNTTNIMLGNLTDMQIRNILTSQVVGRLACTDGKKPYVVPVTFAFDGEFIYGQTNDGQKLRILRKNPNVCLEVDMMTNMANWQSVLVFGKFEELKGEKSERAREILFNRVFPLMTSSTIHPHQHEVTTKLVNGNRVKYVMYRIKINKITGRFEKQ
jgi:nitroimidazol reductase NimA-like FMN-containing flavoprotein (pyridoxamine 5'-phosphate oxidase superfamily)